MANAPYALSGPISGIAIPSAAFTTTQTADDIVNGNGKYLHVILKVTSAGTGSVTLSINGKSASGIIYTILTGAAVVTNSTNVYKVGPGLPVTTNISANDMVPQTIQIVVTANNANTMTYSVDYVLGV